MLRSFSQFKISSDRKFGFFFTAIFALATSYFYFHGTLLWLILFLSASIVFLYLSIIESGFLRLLNVVWLRFGLLLGIVFRPIALGILFFGVITPVALFTKVFGRDELRLKLNSKTSYWVVRKETSQPNSFENQF